MALGCVGTVVLRAQVLLVRCQVQNIIKNIFVHSRYTGKYQVLNVLNDMMDPSMDFHNIWCVQFTYT